MTRVRPRVVQYCSSLGKPCGIAQYTTMLCEESGHATVRSLDEIDGSAYSHVHVQHEFGIMPLEELQRVQHYCHDAGLRLYVTMHTVIPQTEPSTDVDFPLSSKDSQAFIARHADCIVVHNEASRASLLTLGARRVEVIPHGIRSFFVSPSLFSDADGLYHIGCFGHCNSNRGLLEIVGACEMMEHVRLHIYSSTAIGAGNDAYVDRVRALAAMHPWIVLHTEHLPLDSIVWALSQCDLNVWYCHPPKGMSASGSICQYIAAQRPIVASENFMVDDLRRFFAASVAPGRPDLLRQVLQKCQSDRARMPALQVDDLLRSRSWSRAFPEYRNSIDDRAPRQDNRFVRTDYRTTGIRSLMRRGKNYVLNAIFLPRSITECAHALHESVAAQREQVRALHESVAAQREMRNEMRDMREEMRVLRQEALSSAAFHDRMIELIGRVNGIHSYMVDVVAALQCLTDHALRDARSKEAVQQFHDVRNHSGLIQHQRAVVSET